MRRHIAASVSQSVGVGRMRPPLARAGGAAAARAAAAAAATAPPRLPLPLPRAPDTAAASRRRSARPVIAGATTTSDPVAPPSPAQLPDALAQEQERPARRRRAAFDKPPHITYTVSKREVTPAALHALYRACARDSGSGAGAGASHTRRAFVRHWGEPRALDAAFEAKLVAALHNSVAVVAAFTRDPRISDDDDDDDEDDGALDASGDATELYFVSSSGAGEHSGGGISISSTDDDEYLLSQRRLSNSGSSSTSRSSSRKSSSSSNSRSSGGGWLANVPLLSRLARRPPRLVGFARAAGDYALVATVHDVLVHPSVRGCGVGGRLVRKLVSQITAAGVGDIGLVTPAEVRPFFAGAAFDLDREASVPMALAAGPAAALAAAARGADGPAVARVRSSASLKDKLYQSSSSSEEEAVALTLEQQEQDDEVVVGASKM